MTSMPTGAVRAPVPLWCSLPHLLYQMPSTHLMHPNSTLCPQETSRFVVHERARIIQGRSSHMEGEEHAREQESMGKGQVEIFSLKKLMDCLPVPGAGAGAGAPGTEGPSWGYMMFKVGCMP